MKLKYSLCDTLKDKAKELSLNRDFLVKVGKAKFFRYKNKLNIKVNPPSRILHLTQLSSTFNKEILYELVSIISEPENVHQLHNNTSSAMFLVVFSSVLEATKTLCILHNTKPSQDFSHLPVKDCLF